PGKLKYFAAMLPEGAKAANAGVSYQPFEMLVCALGLRTVSQAKNANTLFFQIGPPPLAPNCFFSQVCVSVAVPFWVCLVFRTVARNAAAALIVVAIVLGNCFDLAVDWSFILGFLSVGG